MANTPKSRRQFESLSDVAERTGLSVRTLRRRIAAGQLPAYRSGPRVLRVDPADVDRLMVLVPTAQGCG
ncbi:helix-turn-helix transcriptional regulator [Flexivirga lutea]